MQKKVGGVYKTIERSYAAKRDNFSRPWSVSSSSFQLPLSRRSPFDIVVAGDAKLESFLYFWR